MLHPKLGLLSANLRLIAAPAPEQELWTKLHLVRHETCRKADACSIIAGASYSPTLSEGRGRIPAQRRIGSTTPTNTTNEGQNKAASIARARIIARLRTPSAYL